VCCMRIASVAWGRYVGNNGGSSVPTALANSASANVVKIYSNNQAFAALKSDNTVAAWGHLSNGGSVTTEVGNANTVQSIYSTNTAFAALLSDGSVLVWGNPNCGASGLPAGITATAIYATECTFAAVLADTSVVAWESGTVATTVPAGLTGVDYIFTNQATFVALKSDNSVVQWGFTDSNYVDLPAAQLGTKVGSVSGNTQGFAAYLAADSEVAVWGSPAFIANSPGSGINVIQIYGTTAYRADSTEPQIFNCPVGTFGTRYGTCTSCLAGKYSANSQAAVITQCYACAVPGTLAGATSCNFPSGQPTGQPSGQPSGKPSGQPSAQPSSMPSGQPTSSPTTSKPSGQPTSQPTNPTGQPTSQPTNPTGQPTSQPTNPTGQPTSTPSSQPSAQPSTQPTGQPTSRPSGQPTSSPSRKPSAQPSGQPSDAPTSTPSTQPSAQPTAEPSAQPSSLPTSQPSTVPTSAPTFAAAPELDYVRVWQVYRTSIVVNVKLLAGAGSGACFGTCVLMCV